MKKFIILLFGLLFTCIAASGQVTRKEIDALAPHPRLLMTAEDVRNIQQCLPNDSLWHEMHKNILQVCDGYMSKPTVKITDGNGNVNEREVLKRVLFLSYAYRIEQKDEYARRAEAEMLNAAKSSWKGEYLGIAELTAGMSIGYDWLYDQLSDSSRRRISVAIIEHGVKPSLGVAGQHFLRAVSNWNLVCNAGVSLGVLATAEDCPDLAVTILNRAVQTLYMRQYSPDGNYPEGYGYWGYGTNNIVLLIDVLQKCFGTDFGLSATEGFMRSAESVLHSVGTSGYCFNFSDTKPVSVLNPSAFWFAVKNNDSSLVWNEKALLEKEMRLCVNYRLSPLAIIWGCGISTAGIPQPITNIYVARGLTPVALMRSGWGREDIYIGFKGGTALAGHSHMDEGTFVIDADGERWATDFGSPAYTTEYFTMVDADAEAKRIVLKPDIEYLKVFTQDNPRWQFPQAGPYYHNIVTINNALLDIKGFVNMERYGNTEHLKYAVANLESLYFGKLAEYERGVAIVDNRYAVVRDEMKSVDAPIEIRWAMLTDAEAEITNARTVVLSKNGKRLQMRFNSEYGELAVTKTDIPKTRKGFVGDCSLLTLSFVLPAGQSTYIETFLIPQSNSGRISSLGKIKKWK